MTRSGLALSAPEAVDELAAPFSIVCLSPQRWAADLPTNRQQIMLRASRKGHAVLFVETGNFLGRHLWSLIRGGGRRSLAAQLGRGEPVAPGIRACKAVNVAPRGHTYRLANAINCFVTGLKLRLLARSLPRPLVIWVYDPCAAPIAARLGASMVVYDCVDDYPEQTGGDPRGRALVAEADRAVAARSRLVFATATPLYQRHRAVNPRTHLVRNVADYAHFAPAANKTFADPEMRKLPGPVIGFSGNLMATKVDLALIEALAEARPGWSFVLVGPVRQDALQAVEQLASRPNVCQLGPRAYGDVPRVVAGFDVALIPYVASAYTRSCFPLKTYEYLAAGKPVVASGLPELAGMEPDVRLVDGVEQALAAVETALGELGEEHRARRMRLAAVNTWESRTEQLLGLISAELVAS